MSIGLRYRFDGMSLDPATGELERGDVRRSLPPQQAAVLTRLVERAGELVSRDELYALLWQGVHVDSEHGLNFAVRQLRIALGDDARAPRFIETVRGRGYRFIAKLESGGTLRLPRAAAAASLAAATLVAIGLGAAWQWLERKAPPQRDAVEAYVAARYLATRSKAESIQRSVPEFEKAIRLDASFAPAHAGLAEVQTVIAERRLAPPGQAFRRARDAAEGALRLDPKNAQALLARGLSELYLTFDWTRAAPYFERAVRSDPDATRARLWRARSLAGLGRTAEAIEEAESLVVADPTLTEAVFDLGWFYYLAGRHEQAARTCRRVLDLNDDAFPAWRCLAMTETLLGRDAQAAEAAVRAGEIMGASLQEKHEMSLSSLLTWAADAFEACPMESLSIERAQLLALAGRPADALTSLRDGFEGLHPWAPFVSLDPAFEAMRSDPAFLALLQPPDSR